MQELKHVPDIDMYAINKSPAESLPLHFESFRVRSIFLSEMASEQKAVVKGSGYPVHSGLYGSSI